MKRIGILGGTFDPPHIGHLLIAEEVRVELKLEEVWFIPTQEAPHKEKSMTNAIDRSSMLEIAVSSNPYFKVEPIEMERSGKSYSFDTMQELKHAYPENKFYFIIGADMVEYLPHWYKIEELLDLVTFVGVTRKGFQLYSSNEILSVDVPTLDISSTFIRERLANNETVNYLIPESVYTYIKEKRLYGSKRSYCARQTSVDKSKI